MSSNVQRDNVQCTKDMYKVFLQSRVYKETIKVKKVSKNLVSSKKSSTFVRFFGRIER